MNIAYPLFEVTFYFVTNVYYRASFLVGKDIQEPISIVIKSVRSLASHGVV